MRCRYLRNYSLDTSQWVVISCAARKGLYIPSVYELHGYCIGKGHRLCPYYLRKIFNRRQNKKEAAA